MNRTEIKYKLRGFIITVELYLSAYPHDKGHFKWLTDLLEQAKKIIDTMQEYEDIQLAYKLYKFYIDFDKASLKALEDSRKNI